MSWTPCAGSRQLVLHCSHAHHIPPTGHGFGSPSVYCEYVLALLGERVILPESCDVVDAVPSTRAVGIERQADQRHRIRYIKKCLARCPERIASVCCRAGRLPSSRLPDRAVLRDKTCFDYGPEPPSGRRTLIPTQRCMQHFMSLDAETHDFCVFQPCFPLTFECFRLWRVQIEPRSCSVRAGLTGVGLGRMRRERGECGRGASGGGRCA